MYGKTAQPPLPRRAPAEVMGSGQAASCRAGPHTSAPRGRQQRWCCSCSSAALGRGRGCCWRAEVRDEAGLVTCEHFSLRCAFPASPSTLNAPHGGQAGCEQSGFELLLSYLAPKPQPRSQTRRSPTFLLLEPAWEDPAEWPEAREEPPIPFSFQRGG